MDTAEDFVPQHWLISKVQKEDDVLLKIVFQDVEGSLESTFKTDPAKLDETLQGLQVILNRIEQQARVRKVGVRQ